MDMPERPGSDGLPKDWLTEQFRTLNERMSAHSKRLEDGFDRIDRRFERLETLTGIVASHTTLLAVHEKDIDENSEDIKTVTQTANRVSGMGALLAILVGLLPLPWKH
jgi:hypothetical protein